MAKPRSNSEMIHRYANGYREQVRVNNLTIGSRGELYSYQLMIARPVGKTLLIYGRSSTSTTNRHLSKLRYAANHLTTLRVMCIESVNDNNAIVQSIISDTLAEAARARTRRDYILGGLQAKLQAANAFAELEGQKPQFDVEAIIGQDLKALATRLRAESAERMALLKAEAAEREALYAKILDRWADGDPKQLDWYAARNTATRLRIVGEEIETSHGAKVPLSVAPVLWKMIERARAKHNDYEPGIYVGHYRLTKISDKGDVTIGCHEIGYSELHRIAVQLGYVQKWGIYNSIAEAYWHQPMGPEMSGPRLFDSKELAQAFIDADQVNMETDPEEGSLKLYDYTLDRCSGRLIV